MAGALPHEGFSLALAIHPVDIFTAGECSAVTKVVDAGNVVGDADNDGFQVVSGYVRRQCNFNYVRRPSRSWCL